MKEILLTQYSPEALDSLLNPIPFFNDLSLHDHQQYELLLKHSKVIELGANEHIIRKGAKETTFYFLLKGQLNVFADPPGKTRPLGQLSPGQVFGALAIINDQPRNASLAASKEGATLFATDFTIFGEAEDFSQVKLETKLSLLRIVANNTRWKLEVFKMNEPDHPLVSKMDALAPFTGTKNTIDELRYLTHLSFNLGKLLTEWNQSQLPAAIAEAPKKKGLFSFLGK